VFLFLPVVAGVAETCNRLHNILEQFARKLSDSDAQHLEAAQAWLVLGDATAADEELEKISPEFKTFIPVLETKYQIFHDMAQWKSAAGVGHLLTLIEPHNPLHWVRLTAALSNLGWHRRAIKTLVPALKLFPGDGGIPYLLALQSVKLRKLEQARCWFLQAFSTAKGKHLRRNALANPELKKLWPWLGRTKTPPRKNRKRAD
jgi:tetratricopeptide (TPR) repeat protein